MAVIRPSKVPARVDAAPAKVLPNSFKAASRSFDFFMSADKGTPNFVKAPKFPPIALARLRETLCKSRLLPAAISKARF